MNEKYQTTYLTDKPYYPELIWVTMDKYRKRLIRESSIEEEYISVEFEKVDIKKQNSNLPQPFLFNNFL